MTILRNTKSAVRLYAARGSALLLILCFFFRSRARRLSLNDTKSPMLRLFTMAMPSEGSYSYSLRSLLNF